MYFKSTWTFARLHKEHRRMLLVRWEALIQQLIAYKGLSAIKFSAAQGLCVIQHHWAAVTWTPAFIVDSQWVSSPNLLLADCRPASLWLPGLPEHPDLCEQPPLAGWDWFEMHRKSHSDDVRNEEVTCYYQPRAFLTFPNVTQYVFQKMSIPHE